MSTKKKTYPCPSCRKPIPVTEFFSGDDFVLDEYGDDGDSATLWYKGKLALGNSEGAKQGTCVKCRLPILVSATMHITQTTEFSVGKDPARDRLFTAKDFPAWAWDKLTENLKSTTGTDMPAIFLYKDILGRILFTGDGLRAKLWRTRGGEAFPKDLPPSAPKDGAR